MQTTLYLAPLQGVGSCSYRVVYFKHFRGCDIAMSPFMAGCNVTDIKSKTFKDVRQECNVPGVILIPQILGNKSADFIQMANLLFAMGYEHINFNLGCPYPRVRNKKRGSGLLAHPDDIVRFLQEVVAKTKSKISIKVRLGVKNSSELFRLLPMLDNIALENIIIHPRTAEQMYGGQVDLDAFEKALALTRHKVVYNGDIYSFQDFQRISGRFKQIDQWMLGRGAVRDPFLFERIKGMDIGDEAGRFRAFHDELFESYRHRLHGPSHLMHKMKELWCYWAFNRAGREEVIKKISRVKSIPAYQAAVHDIIRP